MAAQHTPSLSHPWKPPLLLLLLAVITFLCAAAPAAAQSSHNNSSNSNNNVTGPTGRFNPSMAIVIVVLISAFFFLGFFSIYVRQCAGDGGRGASFTATARNLQAAARARLQRGLDPAVLQTFPTLVYSDVKGLKIGKGSLECAVCLSEFEDDENLRLLPKCSHAFHPDCIDAWLSSHVTCPVCRANLEGPIEDSRSPAELLHVSGIDADPATERPVPPPTPPPPPSEQVVINVDQEKASLEAEAEDEAAELVRIRSQRRQLRAAATGRLPALALPRRYPRSHSTGHSVVQPGENLDRYTLRLPEHIRQEIMAVSRLQRTRSYPVNSTAAGRGEGSMRQGSARGWRSVRLGRSGRWPSFLVRTRSLSAWGSRRGVNGDGESSIKNADGEGLFKKSGSTRGIEGGEGSVRGKLFDCLGGGSAAAKPEGAVADESPTAPLARV